MAIQEDRLAGAILTGKRSVCAAQDILHSTAPMKALQGVIPPQCMGTWRVPNTFDWQNLVNYLGGREVAGGKLKVRDTLYWNPNVGATNSSGFSGLPGGMRTHFDSNPIYFFVNTYGYWWSNLEISNDIAEAIVLNGSSIGITVGIQIEKKSGLSVRCIRAQPTNF